MDGSEPARPVSIASPQPWYVLPLMGMVGEAVFVAGLILSYRLDNPTLFNVALGAAIGQAQMVISYFFGSSVGSAKKDDASVASALKKEEVTAAMATALASSTPPPVTTTTKTDPGPPPTVTTTTTPVEQPAKTETPP